MKVLVTGGVRSGKSAYAESLLADRPTLYVAPGPTTDEDPDPDWADRLARHRARRPASWETRETRDLAAAVSQAGGPVLVDCLGTWLTALLDEAGWDAARDALEASVGERLDALVEAVAATTRPVVLVTNEVGSGVVPEHRSGRVFRDLLGTVNQRVATVCDDVVLVVAGRTLHL
ncbi:bifunctional adenosylcobinamide kinase/adenosylcobinamide-phosphate guanylyltransferase [Nocardioides sp. CFH 31398]|uniref:bifunctional adenosylcobinamide kinase/adenosylcobinamide-phosphate guanylyltransferase n=1 Tax=Nocardioides sp. CFH 31398 TaxID=2919579 RepID=UPI001F06B718|nr:bifunctional adenosylcobinamide kinase/adenosylcobinamide-phosphate guanylyltransferase [Nocardioides sp. CFH 31398]MCH1865547.1 bifunctional adenosylcobinamide kinase/adenosylcobinamide-phosphate guanylyltransferase [Nocardioides sp. CFH 31398]